MPAGAPFLPELARGLENRFGDRLQDALILLPTRRAVRELSEIFTGDSGAKILPRMRPLADIDPDEPPFEPGYLTGLVEPAMPGAQRRFELARLIGQKHKASGDAIDPSAMLALADPLIAILDDAAMEEVGLEGLVKLAEIKDLAAKHFENAATFYEILQLHWPQHLAATGMMEPMARRVALLNALTGLWEQKPPDHPVIIAGSTGTLGATARLMRCVSQMTDGLLILPGLDRNMPETAWNKIHLKKDYEAGIDVTSEHPQFSLKKLLSVLGLDWKNIPNWNKLPIENARRDLIAEALVPADATADWPARIENLSARAAYDDFFDEALKGLSIIEARTDDEEALAIALIMREAVENKQKTAALITPDPALARRVKARLRRWHINVDYSQGEPLEETATGSFLASILRLAESPEVAVNIAALFKHDLTTLGAEFGEKRRQWLALEKQSFRKTKKAASGMKQPLIQELMSGIETLATDENLSADIWTSRLIEAAELIASSDDTSGAARLWRDDAGEKAAALTQEILAYGDILGTMSLSDFYRLFGMLMRSKVVRPRYGTHPRLQILGPLEARMLTADTIILGSLNESVWPAKPTVQPFLSRGMREAMGLSLPERRLGLAAHDFQQLASSSRVILTRAQRSEDGPRVASRWLWRLQTLINGVPDIDQTKAFETEQPYLEWARHLDFVAPGDVTEAGRPAPKPDPKHRWPKGRQLSVTKIKTWVRDPYAIYARYILGLKPLDDLSAIMGPREFGNALHNGIENFTKTFKEGLPRDAEDKLAAELEKSYLEAGFEDFHLAKERTRLQRVATDLVAWIKDRADERREGVWAEVQGEWMVPEADFKLIGKPDLLEKAYDGITVVDYKTGALPSIKVVRAGFDPQLPLLGAMIEGDVFADKLGKDKTVKDLRYVRIKGSGKSKEFEQSLVLPPGKTKAPADEYITNAITDLKALIRAFDQADTAYHSQPRAKYQDDYGDYDHLARRGEWAKLGNPDTGGGQ